MTRWRTFPGCTVCSAGFQTAWNL
jgi:hypothetical protein